MENDIEYGVKLRQRVFQFDTEAEALQVRDEAKDRGLDARLMFREGWKEVATGEES